MGSSASKANDNETSDEERFLKGFFAKFSINDETKRKEIKEKLISKYNGSSDSLHNLNRKELKEIFGAEIGEYFLVHFQPEKRKVKILNKSNNFILNAEIENINDSFILDYFEEENSVISTWDWKRDPYVIIQYKSEKNRVVWKLKNENENNPLPSDLDYDEVLLPWNLETLPVPNDEHFQFQNEASYLVNWTMRYENEYYIDPIKLQKEGYNGLNKNFHSIHFGVYGLQRFLLAFSDTTNTLYTITFNPRKHEKIGADLANENVHGMINKDLLDRAKSIPIYYIFQYFYDKFGKENKDKKINFVMCGNKFGGSIAEILTALLFEKLSGNYAQNINILSLAFSSQDWCDEDYKKYLAKQNYSIMDRPISTYLKHIELVSNVLSVSSSSIKAPKYSMNFVLDKKMIEQTLSMKLRVSGDNRIVPKLGYESIYCPMICNASFRFESSQPWRRLELIKYINESEMDVNGAHTLNYEGEQIDEASIRKTCSIRLQTYFNEIVVENIHVESFNAKDEFHMSQLQTFEYYLVFCSDQEFKEYSSIINAWDSVLNENFIRSYFFDIQKLPRLSTTIADMRSKSNRTPEDFTEFGAILSVLNEYLVKYAYRRNIRHHESLKFLSDPYNCLFHVGVSIYDRYSSWKLISEYWNDVLLFWVTTLSSTNNVKEMKNKNTLEIEREIVKQLGIYLELGKELNFDRIKFNELLEIATSVKGYKSWHSWFFKIEKSILIECFSQILSTAFMRKFLRNNYFVGIFGTRNAGKSILMKKILRHFGEHKKADSIASGLGNGGETLGISMFTLDINGKKINFIDFPGSDGLTTSKVFKEGRLQLDIAIAMTNVIQGINQGVVEVVYESQSNSPQALMILNNQADKLQDDSIGTDERLEEFKVNTLNELNFGVERYSNILGTKPFTIEKEQMYLTAINPRAGAIKRNGVLYGEEVINEIIRICDRLR